jgi:hypothetical protein
VVVNLLRILLALVVAAQAASSGFLLLGFAA